MWTHFHDMHSGGGSKEQWCHIFIEAPEAEAEIIFQNRFGHNPHRVTCTCCGEDYSLSEAETLQQATAYERGLQWIEDERGWLYGKDRPADYRDGRYIEPGETIPEGYHAKDKFRWNTTRTLVDYLASGEALAIYAADIKPEDRVGTLRESGYVWVD